MSDHVVLWLWRGQAVFWFIAAILWFVDGEVSDGLVRLLLSICTATIAGYKNDELKRKAGLR